MEAIEQVPKTALDVFHMLPEGTLFEVIDNVLYMAEPRNYIHQKLVGKLATTLLNYLDEIQKGIVAVSPADVYFEEFLSAVQPDLFHFTNENRCILKDDGCIHGASDLIVEVLSSDKKRDKVYKKSLYEKAGVKEYYIVNPVNKNVLAYSLQNGVYDLMYNEDGLFSSQLLGFTFRF